VFENRVQNRIFGPKRDEVTEEWRKLHNIFRLIKSRRMGWAGHVGLMGEGEAYTEFWWGNLRERNHLEDPGIDGTAFHPDSAWKRKSNTCTKLTSAECTVENS